MAILRACAFIAIALLAALDAKAEIIAYRFQGVIETFYDNSDFSPGVQAGDLIEGGFTYNTQMLFDDENSRPDHFRYYSFAPIDPQEIWMTVGGTTFTAGPADGLTAIVEVDRFSLFSNDLRDIAGSDETIGLDLHLDNIVMDLSLPSSLSLLTHIPSIAYVRMWESATYRADVSITSLVRVPEPSTFAMLLAALPLPYLAYRRRC